MYKVESIYQVEKAANIITAIAKIKQGMRELDKNMDGINSFTFEALKGFEDWNDLEDWDSDYISFNKEVF